MKPKVKAGVFVFALTFLAACITRTTPETSAADEQSIRGLESEMLKAAQAKDAAKFASFYTEDASLMAPNAPIATGPAAIRKSWDQTFALPGVVLTFSTTKLEVSGTLGYTQGHYQFTVNDPQGKPVTDSGKYVTVYRKQADGMWKLVADIFNSDLPVVPPGK